MAGLAPVLATLLTGCGLVKVPANPLGGGSTSTRAAPADAAGPTTTAATATAGPAAEAGQGVAAGKATAAAGGDRPRWCDDFHYSRRTSYTASWFDDVDLAAAAPGDRTDLVFAEAVCATTWDKPAERDRILALRPRWMTAIGYDERDFAVAAGEAKGYVDDQQDLTAFAGPVGEAAAIDGASGTWYWLDAHGARVSMLARFKVARGCYGDAEGEGPDRFAQTPLTAVVLCARDRLDAGRALAEIDASAELNGRSRRDLRQMVREGGALAAAASAWLAARAEDDPGVARMIAIADAQFAEWAKPSATRAKLLADLEAMEAAADRGTRSARAGCEATTVAAWEAVLASTRLPKVPADDVLATVVPAALGTADGYLAYQALRLCGDDTRANRYAQGDDLATGFVRRGPRTATLAAWQAAGGEIRFDDRGLDAARVLGADGESAPGLSAATVAGVIEHIDAADDGVEIRFKRVTAVVDGCLRTRETDRVESISSTGQLTYRRECAQTGKVTVDRTPRPLRTSALFARGLAVGMYLHAIAEGLPIVATASASSSRPVWLLGGAVR